MSNKVQTRALYRELRGALLSKETARACSILQAIVKADPEDTYAKEQLAERGAALCHEHAVALDAAVSQQNAAEVTRLVSLLRSWAEEAWLTANIPAFSRAVSIIREAQIPAPSPRTDESEEPPRKAASNAQTKELYRELRGAVVARNHLRSFDILCRILEIDPQDVDAQEQKKETGRWLCDAHRSDLAAVLSTHDNEAIRTVVERFRAWADEAYLKNHVASYAQAAAIADAMKRKELEREIVSLFARLRAQGSLAERIPIVEEIERRSVNNGLELDSEQQKELNAVRKDQRAIQVAEERRQLLEEAEEVLGALRETYHREQKTEAVVTAYIAGLQKLREELSQHEMFPDLETFYARVVKYQDVAVTRLHQLRRAKWMKRCVGIAVSWVLLLAAGGTIYLYSTVDRETALIRAYLEANDHARLKMVVESGKWSSVTCYRKISKEYELAFKRAEAWLKAYEDKLRIREEKLRKFREVIVILNKEVEESDMFKLMEAAGKCAEAKALEKELHDTFGYSPTTDETAALAHFDDVLRQRRGAIMAYFFDKSDSLGFSDLVQRHKRFSEMWNALEVSEEEKAQYQRNLNDYVESKLLFRSRSPWNMTAEEVNASLKLYDEHAAELELDSRIKDTLLALQRQAGRYAQREKDLLACSSLPAFTHVMQGFSAYSELAKLDVYQKKWIDALPKHLPNMAVILMVEKTPEAANALRDVARADYEKTLREVKAVFCGSSEDVYMGNFNRTTRQVIDRIVPAGERSSPLWSPYVVQYRGKTIYTVDKRDPRPKINGEEYIYPLTAAGKTQESKVSLLHRTPHIQLSLDTMRRALGFDRDLLLEKKISPVQLMRNIAQSHGRAYPMMARAYLFSECVTMLSSYDGSPASGVALSHHLREDMKKYHKVASMSPAASGSWLEAHSARREKVWEDFFHDISGHDYCAEIVAAIDAVLTGELCYAGFVGEDGQQVHLKDADAAELYYVRWTDDTTPRLEAYSAHDRHLPYTPIFSLIK